MFLFKQRVTSRTRLGQSSCDPPNIKTHNYVSFLSITAAIQDKCTQRGSEMRVKNESRMETPPTNHTQELLQQLFVQHTWGESITKVRINWGDFQPETASNGAHIHVKNMSKNTQCMLHGHLLNCVYLKKYECTSDPCKCDVLKWTKGILVNLTSNRKKNWKYRTNRKGKLAQHPLLSVTFTPKCFIKS